MSSRFGAGAKTLEIDAERDDAVVALEPLGGGLGGLRRGREERVDRARSRSRRERRAG